MSASSSNPKSNPSTNLVDLQDIDLESDSLVPLFFCVYLALNSKAAYICGLMEEGGGIVVGKGHKCCGWGESEGVGTGIWRNSSGVKRVWGKGRW